MKKIVYLSAATIALGLSGAALANVSLSSHGTAGSRAEGIGIAVDAGIIIINVANSSQSTAPAKRKLAHDSKGFDIDVEGGVRCKFGSGITRAGAFIGGTDAGAHTPSGKPRERYYADTIPIPAKALHEGTGGIALDPVAIVERALKDHVAKGGDAAAFLRHDHAFSINVPAEFKGVCRKKIGGGPDTGGYWYQAATAATTFKVTVNYVGDPDIGKAKGVAARPSAAPKPGQRVAPPAKEPQAAVYMKYDGIKGEAAADDHDIDSRGDGDDGDVATRRVRPPENDAAQPEAGGGLLRGAKSLFGGILRGKKVKDAVIDAALGETENSDG
ncbi:hypothetical protein FSZ31_11690 [Sphingorhabdus soli]|uniref:Uncharacterized protein n=1 Tax=Flavisphingopyxis soli TaxID=2601267 RepID=A0A5C6U9S6_9SPHN|nr:hypothetical protein [Sphingorhabdus soli]TXC68328.1 hypothetical protein FSZ31_11690 [Sphingorhabdus soli]